MSERVGAPRRRAGAGKARAPTMALPPCSRPPVASEFAEFAYTGGAGAPAAKRPKSDPGSAPPVAAPVARSASRRVLDSDDDDEGAPPRPSDDGIVTISSDEEDEAAPVPVAAPPRPAYAPLPSPSLLEPSADRDALDDVEAIAGDLRAALGAPAGGERYAATGEGEGAEGGAGVVVSGAALAALAGHVPPASLKPYQVLGVNFLLLLESRGVGGAIVADEMGLGKTAQAATFLGAAAARAAAAGAPLAPALIVVPSSLLDNWARELATWAPRLRVAKFWGADRAALKDAPRRAAPSFDVLLASYPTFERGGGEAKECRSFLRRHEWSTCVLDEAHAVKNAASSRASRIKTLASGCSFRLFLTGTPLQNRLAELESMLELLLPDIFAGGAARLVDGADADPDASAVRARAVERARRALGPFVLRRLKSEVASQLVPKTRLVRELALLPAQRATYDAEVARVRVEAAAAAAAAGGRGGGDGSALVAALGSKLAQSSFTRLRKAGQHPLLLRTITTDVALDELAPLAHAAGLFGDECGVDRVRAELATYSDFAIHALALAGGPRFAKFLLPGAAVEASCKAAWLVGELPRLAEKGSRVLLFSGWTTILDILQALLDRLGLSWSRLDGSTPVAARLALVDAFNEGGPDAPAVMLLSTRAGGQGLNLTGADTVILHDVDFNPQIDLQAEDRAHRLGQTKPVTVVRLVARDTVDAAIAGMADRKAALGAAVLGEGAGEEAAAGESAPAVGRLLADALREG